MNSCQKILPGKESQNYILQIINGLIFWHELGFKKEKINL